MMASELLNRHPGTAGRVGTDCPGGVPPCRVRVSGTGGLWPEGLKSGEAPVRATGASPLLATAFATGSELEDHASRGLELDYRLARRADGAAAGSAPESAVGVHEVHPQAALQPEPDTVRRVELAAEAEVA